MKNLLKCFLLIAVLTALALGIKASVNSKVKVETETTKTTIKAKETTTIKSLEKETTKEVKTTVEGTSTTIYVPQQTEHTTKAQTTVSNTIPKSEYQVYGFEEEMLSRVNALRTEAGVSPVSIDESLNNMSRLRAKELSVRYRSDHLRPDDSDWSTVLSSYPNAWATAGENIAFGQTSCKEIMEDWAASMAHYQNIIKADYQYVGFGCYMRNGVLYWDQIFLGT